MCDLTLRPLIDQSHVADDEDPDAGSCIRCGAVISGDAIRALASSIPNGEFVPVPLRTAEGVLLTPTGALYCSVCGSHVQICRECGCTDEAGCIDGCWWEDTDLCSRCVVPQVRPYVIGGY